MATYGHGQSFVEPSREPRATCSQRHPLLEDVRCQRLTGHPGEHGAFVESASSELTVRWANDQERPSPKAG